MSRFFLSCFVLMFAMSAVPPSAMVQGAKAPVEEIWQPARTPPGGTSWKLLEQTKLIDRTDKASGMIFTRPGFPPAVQTLSGKQVKLAGWMMPLENAARQKRFVLLAYPPGCPFHVHALPNQFVEVNSTVPVLVDDMNPIVMTGTLQLTGQDESGIFYKLVNARPG